MAGGSMWPSNCQTCTRATLKKDATSSEISTLRPGKPDPFILVMFHRVIGADLLLLTNGSAANHLRTVP